MGSLHLFASRALPLVAMAILCICATGGRAQISNVRSKLLAVTNDTLAVDTLSIIPGSAILSCHGVPLDTALYRLDELEAMLILRDTTACDTIRVEYRYWPFRIQREYKHKSTDLIQQEGAVEFRPYTIGSGRPEGDFFSDRTLQKSGSISRGIAMGNNQNLSVNSMFDLQLSGYLTDKLQILASVTDNNIPLQPSGNTQQLQDFDQVYIQVFDRNTRLTAGDFVLKRPEGYFLNYFKRAQGGMVQSQWESEAAKWNVQASASVSKGRFGRNVIQGVEGNQGPYRLTGADGERFIIILAGTEQVFIDGRLLERGQDRDYVIDYNAAEIIFTPRQFITKDRRITVEFQYSEKRYARPMLTANLSRQKNRTTWYLNAYSESDAKNQPLQQELSDNDKAVLARAGDNLLEAVISGVDSVGYRNDAVLYALRDSLGYDTVWVYSTNPQQAVYRVYFSQVGAGQGDYAEDGFTPNGRKFKWLAPEVVDNVLVHRGNYIPYVILAAPKQKQLVSAGLVIENKDSKSIHHGSYLKTEAAFSHNDLNTFSSLQRSDDDGLALRASGRYALRSGEGRNTHAALGSYEFTSRNFSPVERFRTVEFVRDWNLPATTSGYQHLAAGGYEFTFKEGKLFGGGETVHMHDYNGLKARASAAIKTTHWHVDAEGSSLYTSGSIRSAFTRHKSTIVRSFGPFRLGYKDEREDNLRYAGGSDTLTTATYRFFDWEVNAGLSDTLRQWFTVHYRQRTDAKPLLNELSRAALADQYGAEFNLKGQRENRLRINVANRRLRPINEELLPVKPENTLVGRTDYNFRTRSGLLSFNTFYEVGSGLEQKREFIYLQVPEGQGVYVWNDYNSNGVKELNEFEVAQFAYDANYIRSFIQTGEYVRTYTNQFSQTLNLTPARAIKKKTGIAAFAARFSDQAALRTDRKTNSEDENTRFNPLLTQVADSTLLSVNSSVRNTLFFNKGNPAFGMEHIVQSISGRQLLTGGFESRADRFNQVNVRFLVAREWQVLIETRAGTKTVLSDFLQGRNFEIDYRSLQPRLTWQRGVSTRMACWARYADKHNTAPSGGENAEVNELGTEATFNAIDQGTVLLNFTYLNMKYGGDTQSSLAFEMLEGLSPGHNYTWTASVQRNIGKYLQLNLTYNGRKPGTLKTIHNGAVQLRALF